MSENLRKLLVAVCIVLVLNLVGCKGFSVVTKLTVRTPMDITHSDANYVFLSSDIKNLDWNKYKKWKVASGRTYYFSKGVDKKGGFSSLYYDYLEDTTHKDREVKIVTKANIFPDIDTANVLTPELSSVTKYAYSENEIRKTDPKAYGADEAILAVSKDKEYLKLRNGRIVFEVEIIGMVVKEEQIKDAVINKLNYLKKNQKKLLTSK